MIFYSNSTISSCYLAFDDKNENGLSPEIKTGPTFFKSINFTIVEKSASKAMWLRLSPFERSLGIFLLKAVVLNNRTPGQFWPKMNTSKTTLESNKI